MKEKQYKTFIEYFKDEYNVSMPNLELEGTEIYDYNEQYSQNINENDEPSDWELIIQNKGMVVEFDITIKDNLDFVIQKSEELIEMMLQNITNENFNNNDTKK